MSIRTNHNGIDAEYMTKLQKQVELGEHVENFLKSDMWGLINGFLTDSIAGIRDIATVDVSSEKKTQAAVIGRKMAIDYMMTIPTMLQAHVQAGQFAAAEIVKIEKGQEVVIRA